HAEKGPSGPLAKNCYEPARSPHDEGRPDGRPSRSRSAGLQGFRKSYALVGRDSGGGIRTRDLRVMSPTSYQTAPPRVAIHVLAKNPPAVGPLRTPPVARRGRTLPSGHRLVGSPARPRRRSVLDRLSSHPRRYRIFARMAATTPTRQIVVVGEIRRQCVDEVAAQAQQYATLEK